MNKLSVQCLLYTDDQVFLASSVCELQEIVTKMNDAVKKKGKKVNVTKTKCRLSTSDGRRNIHIERRVNAGHKVNGALLAVRNNKMRLTTSAFGYP
ncbi:hypothetical protein EVAR_56302_1 [Eumeta japonica]|uniref:Reverse transcriptase domain-containing protein n=1 Tax=Eumeta variegata TaxID=151549 RepID=A0A4C1Z3M4_EUMVA|nr:hypothetical protein EVAR_56302_1 [Eumeta japonica]